MNIDKIVDIVRNLNEEGMVAVPTNNASSGESQDYHRTNHQLKKRNRQLLLEV